MMEVPQWLLRGSPSGTFGSARALESSSSSDSNTMRGMRKLGGELEDERERLFGGGMKTSRRTMQNGNENNTKNNNKNEEKDDKKQEQDNGNPSSTVDVDVEDPEDEQPTVEETEEQESDAASVVQEETVTTANQEGDTQQPEEQNVQQPDATTTTATTTITSSEGETRIDLVRLVPFDVKLSLATYDPRLFNSFALTDIVTEWMDESLTAQITRMELGITHSDFDSVILEERSVHKLQTSSSSSSTKHIDGGGDVRRHLEQLEGAANTIASYEGVTLWKHTGPDQEIMTPSLLEDIQRQVLLQDDRLLQLLQESAAQGLGESVIDVRAYINPNPTSPINTVSPTTGQSNNVAPQNSNTNKNLELIIVVAIVVACMAFAFLVFSLFWAWRFDQQRRDQAYRVTSGNNTSSHPSPNKVKSPSGSGGGTDQSEYDDQSSPANMDVVVTNEDDDTALEYPASVTNPTTGGGGIYPESVVSEDISTSLSAYYRSGMGTRPLYSSSRGLGNGEFNDQASFSSMESYGYSLDGYAPSLGGNTYSNNNAPASGNGKADTTAEEDKTASP